MQFNTHRKQSLTVFEGLYYVDKIGEIIRGEGFWDGKGNPRALETKIINLK